MRIWTVDFIDKTVCIPVITTYFLTRHSAEKFCKKNEKFLAKNNLSASYGAEHVFLHAPKVQGEKNE